MECVSFKIDGEWLTDLVRSWFWDENKEYSVCEELLLNSLVNPDISIEERKDTARQIIEGRKKLVGVNSFELVDDNKNVRPITAKLDEQYRKLRIKEFECLLNTRMIPFVDPFSTVKSLRMGSYYGIATHEQCMAWFWYSDDAFDHINLRPLEPGDGMLLDEDDDTLAGLWLYDYPDIVYDAYVKSGKSMPTSDWDDPFWAAVYELITNDKYCRFESKWFKKRNQSYSACLRMKTDRDSGEVRQITYKKELPQSCLDTIDFCKEWLDTHEKDDSLKYYTIHFIHSALTDEDRFGDPRMYAIVPDDYETFEGLISPTGDFYSCDFGGHSMKAYYIMCAYPEKFPDFDYDKGTFDYDTALDYILEHGWCATRWLPIIGSYIELPCTESRQCTKGQENAIFDTKIKHNRDVDLSPIGY